MVRNDYIDLFDIPSLDDIVVSPYFVKELDRYNKQKVLMKNTNGFYLNEKSLYTL